jgi:hypothetical protein
MLSVFELEELARLNERTAIAGGVRAKQLAVLEDGDEDEQVSLRHRLASAIILLGVKLDPSAAESLKENAA